MIWKRMQVINIPLQSNTALYLNKSNYLKYKVSKHTQLTLNKILFTDDNAHKGKEQG